MRSSAPLTPDRLFARSQCLGFGGRDKCGLAVMGLDRQLHYHQVIATGSDCYPSTAPEVSHFSMVMGDQTVRKAATQSRISTAIHHHGG